MSQTQLYVVQSNGDVVLHASYPNSHRSAPLLWGMIWAKYLGPTYHERAPHPELVKRAIEKELLPMFDSAEWSKFFGLDVDPRLTDSERFALQSTYDRCIVKREAFGKLLNAYRDAESQLQPRWGATHFHAIVKDVEQLLPDVRGVAFRWTTVSSDLWDYWKMPLWDGWFEGDSESDPDDPAFDTYRSYNVDTDKGYGRHGREHWWLE